MLANLEPFIDKPGVEYRRKDQRELVILPPNDHWSSLAYHGRKVGDPRWMWFVNKENAEKFMSGEDELEVYC